MFGRILFELYDATTISGRRKLYYYPDNFVDFNDLDRAESVIEVRQP